MLLPEYIWPGLFFVGLLVAIGILGSLIFTVTSILLERHDDETRRAARESSPDEGYRTFERSFRRDGDDDDDEDGVVGSARRRRNSGSLVIPNRFLNRRGEGLRGVRRHRETFDERRVARLPTAAQRALMGVRGDGDADGDGLAPRGGRMPGRGRGRDGKTPARYAYAGAEETMFDMSV